MKWFTLLVFTYVYDGEEIKTPFLFENEETCEQMLRAADPFYEKLRGVYRDSMVACERTDVASGYTVRPKARPWGN